jgi:hypothetical protein
MRTSMMIHRLIDHVRARAMAYRIAAGLDQQQIIYIYIYHAVSTDTTQHAWGAAAQLSSETRTSAEAILAGRPWTYGGQHGEQQVLAGLSCHVRWTDMRHRSEWRAPAASAPAGGTHCHTTPPPSRKAVATDKTTNASQLFSTRLYIIFAYGSAFASAASNFGLQFDLVTAPRDHDSGRFRRTKQAS